MQWTARRRISEVTALLFDGRRGPPLPVGRLAWGSGSTDEAEPDTQFIVELATDRAADPVFCEEWRALVMAGNSPQKIYQTPEFFRLQCESATPGERMELVTITRRSDASLVGVVPVRLGLQHLCFGIGKLVLFRRAVRMIYLLGSVAAVPGGAGLNRQLAAQLLATFPDAKAVYMKSLPLNCEQWSQLKAGAAVSPLAVALMGQWRACHTLPLPATFDQYLEQFSAKKRYNLNRQIRQLGEQAGALDLQRVDCSEQVAGMMDALGTLVPPCRLTGTLSAPAFEALARHQLLLCYVLRAGDAVLAVVIGTRSPDALHIHNIFVNKIHLSLSVGTSAMHLAVKDLMTDSCFRLIDFGYGTPNHEFRSSHVLETRAQVLLFERKRAVRLLFRAHGLFDTAVESMIARVKTLRKSWQQLRRAKPA